jgi:IPT/TIG domain
MHRFHGILLIVVLITACSDDDHTDLVINSVSPERASVGSTVTIVGSGFASSTTDNIVKFHNDEVAEVLAASPTELTVKVPRNARDGKLTVFSNGRTATSPRLFIAITETFIYDVYVYVRNTQGQDLLDTSTRYYVEWGSVNYSYKIGSSTLAGWYNVVYDKPSPAGYPKGYYFIIGGNRQEYGQVKKLYFTRRSQVDSITFKYDGSKLSSLFFNDQHFSPPDGSKEFPAIFPIIIITSRSF